MTYGLNSNAHSIWLDHELSSACVPDMLTCIRLDWVHSYLQDGVLTIETWLFFQRCEPLGWTHQHLHEFLSKPCWRWPAANKEKAKLTYRIFDSYRNASSETADKLKCSSGELLSVYGMLCHCGGSHRAPGGDLCRATLVRCGLSCLRRPSAL